MSVWNFKDLTGMTFGRLTVIERAKNANDGHARWLCRCSCGNLCIVLGKHLISGKIQSCGCLGRENRIKANTKHSMAYTKVYRTWCNVKGRCFNSKRPDFYLYGGRGITMFAAWINDFQAFYDYVSTLEQFGEIGYSLDRIDDDGNYEPGNLKWSTQAEQNRNQRTNIKVNYNGVEMCLMDAAEKSGLPYDTLRQRYHVGDRGERLFRPAKKYNKQ